MQLDVLPSSAVKVIGERTVHSFAVGTCYGRAPNYPNGVYWVALLFY
jgi:hypothetical protein